MYHVYDALFRAIRTTYTTRTTLDEIQQINGLFRGDAPKFYATQAETGAILGVPGVGKSSTIQRCLELAPQVIEHTEFIGQPFFCKQVLYLRVQCPSDCSVKTLVMNLVSALDAAIGTNYLQRLSSLRSAAVSALATQVKILCMTHHVGLLIVDEVQNAVETARKTRQTKPLMKFFVELSNDTATGIYFVGTPAAEEFFVSGEHLKRRTRGLRLLPLRPDGTYRAFLKAIWPYQYTAQAAPLTDKLANKLYDASGGIPAYIIKIFQEAQVQALLQSSSQISEKIMQQAINVLAIKVPKFFAGGTFLSDFEQTGTAGVGAMEAEAAKAVKENVAVPITGKSAHSVDVSVVAASEESFSTSEAPAVSAAGPRLFANQRGRRTSPRDEDDVLAAFKAGTDMVSWLRTRSLLEEWPLPC